MKLDTETSEAVLAIGCWLFAAALYLAPIVFVGWVIIKVMQHFGIL
jgi:hypothetical protein